MSREDLVQEIIENLSRCQRSAANQTLKDSELSRAQIGMLFMLSYHKRLQVKQIADHLGISKSASSQLLEPLNQKNLITRQTDPKDRRIAYFELTQEGRSQVKKLHKSKFAGLRSHLENLNEKELSTMVELTRKAAAPAKQNR